MKLPFKFSRYGIEWGGEDSNWYYIFFIPHWLPKQYHYWGLEYYYYDGPHASFGFWFFNISWSTPWTKCPEE